MEKTGKKIREKKNRKAYIPLAILLIIVLTVGTIWYSRYLRFITTDDALIDGDNVSLAPKIMGRIVAIYASDGDTVHANQLLVRLDSSDILAQINQAKAMVQQANANLVQASIKYKADAENLAVFEINADKAKTDFDRATRQQQTGVISQEQFENVQKTYQTSTAQLQTQRTQLKVSEAQIETAKAAVETEEALVNTLTTQFQNTKLYSPFEGIVARKWLLPGDIVQMGQTILTLNNTGKIWVSVYIEETKLHVIHIGQKAEFMVDAFPDVHFSGKVIYVGNNTASQFSLIPPSNASGNFTKITQRVQLKISFESVDRGSLNDYNLFPGMSVVMKLIK
jgi:membrane fusion protein (multidrug efflux system)